MKSGSVLFAALLACLCLAPGGDVAALPSWGFALDNGDANGDQDLDLSDGVYLLSYLYLGGPAPVPLAYCGGLEPAVANGDSNGDGSLDVSDAVRLFTWMYSGGQTPVAACAEGDGQAAAGRGVARVAPPHSNAFGKSLEEWLETYWRWYFGGGDDTVGRVQLLALPAGELLSGDFSPGDPAYLKGEIDIELPAGTPFVLPQFAWGLETYDPALGYPDDECFPADVMLASVDPIELTIDGVAVITKANMEDFFIPCAPLDPPVMYAEPTDYGAIGAIGFQSVGFVSPPLPPGDHVIHLYEEWILPDILGVIYDNTWHIHVK